MFCCNGASRTYDPLDTTTADKNKNKNNTNNIMKKSSRSPYPGTRRQSRNLAGLQNQNQNQNFVGTGGNALMAYDPQAISSDPNLLKVNVPVDSVPGQSLIEITAPDGSGRVVLVILPLHLKPGSSFLMKFPTVEEMDLLDDLKLQPEDDNKNDNNNNSSSSSSNNNNSSSNNIGTGGDVSRNKNDTTPTDLLDNDVNEQQNPLEQRLLQNYDGRETNNNNDTQINDSQIQTNNSSVKDIDVHGLMIVSVPPGVEAGSIMYAQIPGPLFDVPGYQKRYVPVTVPNGTGAVTGVGVGVGAAVSQFYTTYSLKLGRTLNEEQVREEERKRIAAAFGGSSVQVPSDKVVV